MARIASASPLHPVLADGPAPLRQRVADSILDALRRGALAPGDLLPSSRTLASELHVSRTVVVDAYDELCAAGFLDSRAGSGTRVAAGADTAARVGTTSHVAEPAPRAPEFPGRPDPALDLSPGLPDTTLISDRDWRSAWRAAASDTIPGFVPGPDSHARLRVALAGQLRRTRGVVVDADEILVVPGVSAALRTIAAAAGLRGSSIAFEDPGYIRARKVLQATGAHIRPVPVDADGLDPAALLPGDRAVYCTPAHQYPTGGRMPVTRRAALLADAAESGRVILEDDYDGEFRYGVPALPALRAIDGGRDRVAYLGTASKILTPALRLAWLIPPAPLLDRARDVLADSGESVCALTADALARFIESGALTRHLARSSRTYAARRQAFVTALHGRLPGIPALGVEAGLHVALRLPDHCDDTALAEDIGRRGVSVRPLSAYRAGDDGPRGLLCGYSRLPESRAGEVAVLIADVIRGSTAAAADISGSCTRSGS